MNFFLFFFQTDSSGWKFSSTDDPATFDLASSGFDDRPNKVICQSFEKRNEHAHNVNITRGDCNLFVAISVQDLISSCFFVVSNF